MDFTLQIINNSNLSLAVYDESNESVSVTTQTLTLAVTGGEDTLLEVASEPFTTIQGPPGPQGPSGSSVGFTYNQITPSNSWTVNHNLGFYPSVTILSPGGIELITNITHTSINQFIASFNNECAGKAIAR